MARQAIRIAAQQQLEAFYASLGFRTASLPYDEDGIAHIDMLLEPMRASAPFSMRVAIRVGAAQSRGDGRPRRRQPCA